MSKKNGSNKYRNVLIMFRKLRNKPYFTFECFGKFNINNEDCVRRSRENHYAKEMFIDCYLCRRKYEKENDE